MSVEAKCRKCGSDDLLIAVNADGEAGDDSPVTCNNCGSQWTFEEHKQQIADSAKDEIKKMLDKFKL